jgi:hypothetical protein
MAAARDAQRQPSQTAGAHLREAWALVNLGHLDEGTAAMDKAYSLTPDISMRRVRALLPPEPGVDLDAYLEGMSKAGLRE